LATFRDLEAYLKRDGWVAEPNLTRGRWRTGDHRRYQKELPDGTVLRTKVSHALGDEIGTDLFKHILRAQLRVDEAAFWVVVRGRGQRSAEVLSPRAGTVPAWLVQRLLFTVGLPEADVRKLTAKEAIELWEAFISRPTSS
jgi:hypothetical protein